MKKVICGVAALLFFSIFYLICGWFGILPLPQSFKNLFRESPESISSTERIAKMIQDTHPTDLMIYGDDVPFREDVPVRKISEITEDSLKRKDGCNDSFLVINDLSDAVQLSDAENELLKQKVRTDHFCLFYLGGKYADVWDQPDEYAVSTPGNLSYQYYWKNGVLQRTIGAWKEGYEEYTELNPYVLGDTVLYETEYFLEQTN